jgi:HK97 family phage prohead protease
MPIPTPRAEEEQNDFISRCMSNETMKDDYPDNDQRLAVCFSAWERGQEDKSMQEHESRFGRDNMGAPGFVTKEAEITEFRADDRMGFFTASTNRVDLIGDIIEQDWDLTDFRKNPAFLFAHESWNPPIGWVREFNTTDDGTATHSRVEFVPRGISPRTDELFELTRIGAIRAVSVGFIPLETEDRFDDEHRWVGYRFLRSRLTELSLCSVGANPDAVALARSINSHPAFIRRVCGDTQFNRPASKPPVPAPELVGTFQRRLLATRDLMRLKGRYPPASSPVSRVTA